MKIFQSLKRSTRLNSFQNKNKAVFDCMVEHGFPMSRIRPSLRVLNGIRLSELTNGKTSVVTASNTVRGLRGNEAVMAGLSNKLGIGVDRLFPDGGE
jgi:hypothetical protein